MQKKIIAIAATLLCGVAAPAMAQTSGASKVELWGVVDAAVRHTNNQGTNRGNLTEMVGGGMSESRFGIKVTEDLGGGSSALVELENRFKSDTGAVPSSYPFFQLAYVGLQGPYGRLTMGRQWNVLFDVVTTTYASFPYSPYMDAYKPELGMAVGARNNNMLKYTIANADRSLVGSLQYSFDEGVNSTALANAAMGAGVAAVTPAAVGAFMGANPGATQAQAQAAIAGNAGAAYLQNNSSSISTLASSLKTMGGYLRYSKNGISVGGGYLKTELPGGSDVDAWTLGGSYRSGPLYVNLGYGLNKFKPVNSANPFLPAIDKTILGSMWSGQTNGGFQPGNANKRQMVKVGFGYQVTPQINAGLHYFHAKQTGDALGVHNGKANFMVAAVDYAFSKRTDAYFAVDHTKVSGGSGMAIDSLANTGGVAVRSRTGITVGLRHRF